jgi:hypothetical protein
MECGWVMGGGGRADVGGRFFPWGVREVTVVCGGKVVGRVWGRESGGGLGWFTVWLGNLGKCAEWGTVGGGKWG